jgi:hypothetical protein
MGGAIISESGGGIIPLQGGGIIQESLGAIIPLQTGGFTGIGTLCLESLIGRSSKAENSGRRRPGAANKQRGFGPSSS